MAYFSSSRVFFIDYTLKYCKWSKPPFVHCKRRRHKTFLLFLSRVTWMTYFSSSRESFFLSIILCKFNPHLFSEKEGTKPFLLLQQSYCRFSRMAYFSSSTGRVFFIDYRTVQFVYLLKQRRNYNQFIFLFRFSRICMPCLEVDISWNNVGFLYFVKHNFLNRLWCWWHHLFN